MSRSSSPSAHDASAGPGWVDWAKLAAFVTVISGLTAWGGQQASAAASLAQKVDRIEFATYVAESERRFQVDSMERRYMAETLRRMEAKQDSTNTRLSRLICNRGPSYCQ